MKYALFYKGNFIETCEFPVEIKVLDKIFWNNSHLIVEYREFDLNAQTIDLHLIDIDEVDKEKLEELFQIKFEKVKK